MITQAFDPSPSITRIDTSGYRIEADACVMTCNDGLFDAMIFLTDPDAIGVLHFCCGDIPVMLCRYKGRNIAFFRSYVGASSAVGSLTEMSSLIDTNTIVVFGSCGSLDAALPANALFVPTAAYRDEGTSYHYAPPEDYIELPGAGAVAAFLDSRELAYSVGKTWTTDAFYRETPAKRDARLAEGCRVVEMEGSAIQAFADFEGYGFFYLLYTADSLSSDKWDRRISERENGKLSRKQKMAKLALDFTSTL